MLAEGEGVPRQEELVTDRGKTYEKRLSLADYVLKTPVRDLTPWEQQLRQLILNRRPR